MLFENYYYNIFTFAAKATKLLREAIANNSYTMTYGGNMIVKVEVDEYTIELLILKEGLGDEPLAELMIDPDDYKLQTVDIGRGIKRKRKLPKTKIAKINVYLKKQCEKFPLLEAILKNKIREKNVEPTFEEICKAFAQTQYFARTIAHEIQHFLKPRVTKMEPKTRQQDIKPSIERLRSAGEIKKTKKELQKFVNYLLSDDEVDSAIAETTAYVFEQSDLEYFFKENIPSKFILPCLEHLRSAYKWLYYTKKIRDRIRKRIERLYFLLRKEYYTLQQSQDAATAAAI